MFVTELHLQVLRDERGLPLCTRGGRQLYRVLQPLVYASDLAGVVAVPTGFVTDLGSVPRLPVVFLVFGDSFQWAAVVHDFLYSSARYPDMDRKTADDILYEACRILGEPVWRAKAIWAAVRLAGGGRFEEKDQQSSCF